MPEIALVNPRRRRKRRTAAQKRATRRMLAARRRRAPRAAKPARRRRRWHVAELAVRQANPRRRRNPDRMRGFDLASFAQDTLMPSAVGAAGALGVDVLIGFLPLPPAVKTGPMRPVVRLAGAVGLGMIAGTIASRRTAEQVTAGAVTVVLYDLLKTTLTRVMPQLPLGQHDESGGYIAPAVQIGEIEPQAVETMSAYPADEMSAYVPEGY